jgi:hypothetical protein
MKMLIMTICLAGLLPVALAQDAASKHLTAADAKGHIGETATVCGKVVDSKVSKYGIAGHGKPVSLDMEQPEPNPPFYFVVFATNPTPVHEVIDAYKGKNVCVTGKITTVPAGGPPFIMAADRSQVKEQPAPKEQPAVKEQPPAK